MDFKERTKLKIAISKIEEEEKAMSKNNNFKIKKVIGIAACFAIVFSGIVYAKDIENYLKKIFNNSTEAIDKAIENGYVQQENMDYTYDKDIGIKVDSLIFDDLNLDISFNFETKKENIKSIRFNDFIIKNDNNKVIYQSEIKHVENIEELPLYNSVTWMNEPIKLTDTTFADSILFGLRTEKEDFKELYFDVKSLQVAYMDNTREIIDGTWRFNLTIDDEMRKKTIVIYNMCESNEYVESCTATMSNTETIVELNSKNSIPKTISVLDLIYLKSNEAIYKDFWIDSSDNYMILHFRDVGRFIDNSDILELHLDFFNTTVKLVRENIK